MSLYKMTVFPLLLLLSIILVAGAGDYLEKGEIENDERLLRAGLRLAPDDQELNNNLERLLEQRAC